MRYAQIDGNGICFADSYLSGEVNANDMIPLDENVISPLGKKYCNGEWQEVEQLQLPEPESDTEIIMQSIAELELQGLEAQQERQMLAQQMTDLELTMLERGNI
jgi:hypothetical protein